MCDLLPTASNTATPQCGMGCGLSFAVLDNSTSLKFACSKGVQRERLAHHLRSRCSVLHHNTAGKENPAGFSLPLVDEIAAKQGRNPYHIAVLRCYFTLIKSNAKRRLSDRSEPLPSVSRSPLYADQYRVPKGGNKSHYRAYPNHEAFL